MNRRFFVGLCSLSIAVNVGLTVYYVRDGVLWKTLTTWLRIQPTTTNQKVSRVMKPVLVQVATAKRESIARKKVFLGTIKAMRVVPIMSEIQGKVAKIAFKEGDKVKKGQLLIQLDDMLAKAQLQKAEAQVKVASANHHRQYLLGKYGSQALRDKAVAEKDTALAAREEARVQLQYTRILAPFDGEIGLIDLNVGSQVNHNQEITRLVGAKDFSVEFQVAEAEVKDISMEKEVDVLAEGYDSLPVSALVSAIEPYSDPIAHTIRIRASFQNLDRKFRDGAFANVTVALSSDEDAVVIPKDAVLREGETDHVFVVMDHVVHKRDVIVGMRDGDRVQISYGIAAGDVVAIDPVEMLVDGFPVRIDKAS